MTEQNGAIRVLIVDDDPVVRFGLEMMLRAAADIDIVSSGGDGQEAIELVHTHHPDVVLMDVRMPRMDGLTATEHLLDLARPPRILILTTFDADTTVLRALRAGAAGFLLKDAPPEELVDAIRAVAAGRLIMSADVTRRLIQLADTPAESPRRAAARRRLATLAPREHEVAVEIGSGRSNADIAERHHLSIPTVKTHVSAVLAKLGLSSRVQVALLVHDAELNDDNE